MVIKKGDDETKHKKRGRRREVKQREINNGSLEDHKIKPYSQRHEQWYEREKEKGEGLCGE